MKMKNKSMSRQRELMKVFDFAESDLAKNRVGKLANYQGRRVIDRERWYCNEPIIPGLGFGFFASLGIAALMKDAPMDEVLIFLVLTLGMSLGLFAQSANRWFSIWSDVNRGEVSSTRGIVTVDIGDRRHKPKLSIGSLQLKANRNALLRIKHLEPHIVYFLPRSKIIVSVEVVED